MAAITANWEGGTAILKTIMSEVPKESKKGGEHRYKTFAVRKFCNGENNAYKKIE